MFLVQSDTVSFFILNCPKSPYPPGNNQGKALVNRLLSSSYSLIGVGEAYGNAIDVWFFLLCMSNPFFNVCITCASFSFGICGARDGRIPKTESISHVSEELHCKPDKVCTSDGPRSTDAGKFLAALSSSIKSHLVVVLVISYLQSNPN